MSKSLSNLHKNEKGHEISAAADGFIHLAISGDFRTQAFLELGHSILSAHFRNSQNELLNSRNEQFSTLLRKVLLQLTVLDSSN